MLEKTWRQQPKICASSEQITKSLRHAGRMAADRPTDRPTDGSKLKRRIVFVDLFQLKSH